MGYFANRRRRKAEEAKAYARQRTEYEHTPYPVNPITQTTEYVNNSKTDATYHDNTFHD